MPISSPKSLSIVSALTPPHPRFAHADGWSVILSEPRTPNVCVCSGDNVAGEIITSRREPRILWRRRALGRAVHRRQRSREHCIRTEPPSHVRVQSFSENCWDERGSATLARLIQTSRVYLQDRRPRRSEAGNRELRTWANLHRWPNSGGLWVGRMP